MTSTNPSLMELNGRYLGKKVMKQAYQRVESFVFLSPEERYKKYVKDYPNVINRAPDKIVLAGNSAGGFAVHPALPLIRKLYPDVKIDVINDSGVGVLDPGSMESLINYWNARAFFPASCTDCIGADGNLKGYHKYQLTEDPNIRMAYISSKQDATIAAALSGGGPSFEIQLIEAAAEINTVFPERFQSLIANGDEHTFVISNFDYSIGGTTVRGWIEDMLSSSEYWTSLAD